PHGRAIITYAGAFDSFSPPGHTALAPSNRWGTRRTNSHQLPFVIEQELSAGQRLPMSYVA
ncbi:MAG: hypothetical protein M3300_05955, partial [Actinomycetota bacterium]|nr:hypothetical protein [Actinomycetota bacterium]